MYVSIYLWSINMIFMYKSSLDGSAMARRSRLQIGLLVDT